MPPSVEEVQSRDSGTREKAGRVIGSRALSAVEEPAVRQ